MRKKFDDTYLTHILNTSNTIADYRILDHLRFELNKIDKDNLEVCADIAQEIVTTIQNKLKKKGYEEDLATLILSCYDAIKDKEVQQFFIRNNIFSESLNPKTIKLIHHDLKERLNYRHAALIGEGRAHKVGKGKVSARKLSSENLKKLESRYQNLNGDVLKTQILNDFKLAMNVPGADQEKIVIEFLASPKFTLLTIPQGIGFKAKFGADTDSVKAFKSLIKTEFKLEKNFDQLKKEALSLKGKMPLESPKIEQIQPRKEPPERKSTEPEIEKQEQERQTVESPEAIETIHKFKQESLQIREELEFCRAKGEFMEKIGITRDDLANVPPKVLRQIRLAYSDNYVKYKCLEPYLKQDKKLTTEQQDELVEIQQISNT
jgi:hypothetical protein